MRGVVAIGILVGVLSTPALARQSDGLIVIQDSVSLRFVDAELRVVIQAMGRLLDKPIVVGPIDGSNVTFETPHPIPVQELPALLAGLLDAYGLRLISGESLYQVLSDNDGRDVSALPPPMIQGPLQSVYAVQLKHARATAVAGLLSNLYGVSVVGPSAAAGTLGEELIRNNPPTRNTGVGPSDQSGMVLVPDDATNRILVRTDSAGYADMLEAVAQLDVQPLQVLIRVLIVEIKKDRLFSIGLGGSVDGVSIDRGNGVASGTLTDGGSVADLVIKVMNLTKFDLEGLIRMAESKGDARIVSRPVVLATNNREARILVGTQRPFVQVSRSLATDTPSRDQVVQYRDVGNVLTVVPTINDEGFVNLIIRQEASTATNETQFDAPIISTREIETEVFIRDGRTVILGGMIQRQEEIVKSGVPLLNRLPLIGGLFGSEERRFAETELFIFITPTIVRVGDEAQVMTDREQAASEGNEIRLWQKR